MEFGQIQLCYPAIKLASWSQTCFPTCRRQVRAISTCRDNWNLVADLFAIGLVCPTQPVEIFGKYPVSERGLNACVVAKYSDFGPIEGYISETVQDRR